MRNEGESVTHIQPAAQPPSAVGHHNFLTTVGPREDGRLDRSDINLSAATQLPAREQARDAGYETRSHAGAAGQTGLAFRSSACDFFARGHHTVPPVGFRPIAELQRLAVPARSTDRQDHWRGGRDVRTRTAFVPRRSHDQDALIFAHPDRPDQGRLRFTRLVIHTRADIDHVGADRDGQRDRASQIQLRAGDEFAVVLFAKNRNHHASALRRDPADGTVVLPENQARHLGPVPQANAPRPLGTAAQEVHLPHQRPVKGRMRKVDRSVQDRNADARVAPRQGPQLPQPRQWFVPAAVGKCPRIIPIGCIPAPSHRHHPRPPPPLCVPENWGCLGQAKLTAN